MKSLSLTLATLLMISTQAGLQANDADPPPPPAPRTAYNTPTADYNATPPPATYNVPPTTYNTTPPPTYNTPIPRYAPPQYTPPIPTGYNSQGTCRRTYQPTAQYGFTTQSYGTTGSGYHQTNYQHLTQQSSYQHVPQLNYTPNTYGQSGYNTSTYGSGFHQTGGYGTIPSYGSSTCRSGH